MKDSKEHKRIIQEAIIEMLAKVILFTITIVGVVEILKMVL